MPNWIRYIMGKIKINNGSGKKVLVNTPGLPSTARVNRPPGSAIPIKTGLGIAASAFPVYLRNTANTAEIGTATTRGDAVTLLNADPGWSAYGTWSSDSNGIYCTGSPANIIGYNKVGQTYLTNTLANLTTSNGNLTLGQGSGNITVSTTATVAWYRALLTGYGKTMLSDVEFSFNVVFSACNFGSGSFIQVGIEANRSLTISESGGNDFSGTDSAVTGSLARTLGLTYTFTLKMKEDVITFVMYDGTNTKTRTITRTKLYNEVNCGYFFIDFINCTGVVSNLKIVNTSYKNVDFIALGDSVTWGRGATTNAGSWYRTVVGTKPNTILAHGDSGFLDITDCLHEVADVNPAKVFIMGSYVDTPAGLSTFQTRYAAIITTLKTYSALQKIYHLTSFPNNFGTDIRPFNSWKASTYNTGIDKFISAYYGSLEEAGGTGYNLIDAYDWGGSHLTQAAQDIVAAAITANL